jgi:hypothetical protein
MIQVFWNVTLCHKAASSWYFTDAMILHDDTNTCPTTEHHIPQHVYLQHHCCENLKSHTSVVARSKKNLYYVNKKHSVELNSSANKEHLDLVDAGIT